MKLKEKISLEEVCGQTFKIRVVETSEYGKAAFTHYLHNQQNGVSKFYKKEAIQHVKRTLEYKFPDEDVSLIAAEEALQCMLFDFKKDLPIRQGNAKRQSCRAIRYNLFSQRTNANAEKRIFASFPNAA